MPDTQTPPRCPQCNVPMRLLGKTRGIPARRHWECIHHDLLDYQACAGYCQTSANTVLAANDIAQSLAARPRGTQDAHAHLSQLAERLSSEHDAYAYLSDDEHETLIQAARVMTHLAAKLSQASGEQRAIDTDAARESAVGKRSKAMEGFRDFAGGLKWPVVLERCRSLDRYLKYQRGRGANIEKAADQLSWAENPRQVERARAALSYRVGHVWRFEMTGKISQAGFELFWSDWKASRQVRAAIDRALGQEDYL